MLSSHGREIGTQDALKKDSRGAEIKNSSRLVQKDTGGSREEGRFQNEEAST